MYGSPLLSGTRNDEPGTTSSTVNRFGDVGDPITTVTLFAAGTANEADPFASVTGVARTLPAPSPKMTGIPCSGPATPMTVTVMGGPASAVPASLASLASTGAPASFA